MSTADISSSEKPPSVHKPLSVRLGKTAGMFLGISALAFALVNILANLFQHTFVMIIESIVVGVPFLVAVCCAVGAIVAKIAQHNRHAPV